MNLSDKIKKLFKSVNAIDVHEKDALGDTALLKACYENADNAVELLLKKGADINYYNEKSVAGPATALMHAAAANATEALKVLINNQAEIDTCHKINGMTALMFAAKNNATDVIELLVASGANLEAKTFGLIGSGQTALTFAVIENDRKTVDLLLKKGAKTKPLRALDRKKIPAPMVKWLKTNGVL